VVEDICTQATSIRNVPSISAVNRSCEVGCRLRMSVFEGQLIKLCLAPSLVVMLRVNHFYYHYL